MKRRAVGYLMLAVWGGLFSAGLALAMGLGAKGAFLPDPVLCLVVLIAARLHRDVVVTAAFVLALARIAFTIDPPPAIFAMYMGAALLIRALRSGVDVNGPLVRGWFCFVVVWIDGMWLTLVRAQRQVFAANAMPDAALLGEALGYTLPRAMASGLLGIVLGAVLVRLPGLSAIDRRQIF
ncbi:MAG: hypothetical protein ACI8QC_002966 [Planctomycetota bacterium]|jgi:hypothetical protein